MVPNRAKHHKYIVQPHYSEIKRTLSLSISTALSFFFNIRQNPAYIFIFYNSGSFSKIGFLANGSILYPMRAPENLWFCAVFRRYKMGTLTKNGMI